MSILSFSRGHKRQLWALALVLAPLLVLASLGGLAVYAVWNSNGPPPAPGDGSDRSLHPNEHPSEGQVKGTRQTRKCKGVRLRPKMDIPSKVEDESEGTKFCLDPGVFRIPRGLVLKEDQALIGSLKRATIISGARKVTASPDGGLWVIEGQKTLGTSGFGIGNECRPVEGLDPKGMCVHVDQVFVDNRSLWQVGSLGELSAGEFYWDYSENKIYLAENPTGRKLEVSVTGDRAIEGGSGITLEDLVVEKFGVPVQDAAISASSDWMIVRVEARLNHGVGIRMGPGTVIRDSYIHHNGQLGIAGGQEPCSQATGIKLLNSELSYNNTAGYNWAHEGGATKWNNTTGLIVRGNYVHDNYGPGLWTDYENIDSVFEDNKVVHNLAGGIIHELSYDAVIRNNVVIGNGFGHPIQDDVWGAGISIQRSMNVEVYGNRVLNNNAGITAVHDFAGPDCFSEPHEVANTIIRDNTIRQKEGVATGLRLRNTDDTSFYESKGNEWSRNRYLLGDVVLGLHFFYNGWVTATRWKEVGYDIGSSFDSLPR